jgi:flagellar basal body-associated protein FliL
MKDRIYIVVLAVALCGIGMWVAFWMGSQSGFHLAQRGTYAVEYADATITANLLECGPHDLRSDLLQYVELRMQDLKMTEALQRDTTPLWRKVIGSFYETPVALLHVSADKTKIPPIAKLQERVERLRTADQPDTTCKR